MNPHTIIFIGPQGSGKGTQIEKLHEALDRRDPARRVVDIQTGRRFRALAAKGEGYTEQSVQKTLATGELQPLFLSVSLWGDAMREHVSPDCHVLIDGFPRTVAEAHVLESALAFYERPSLEVINLATPEEVVRGRMELRARDDDTASSIETRLLWYKNEVEPVLAYYRTREHTAVFDIDGTDTVAGVHDAVVRALNIS